MASVAVKAARDPNDTVEKDEPAENAEPTVGEGLEQGASSAIEETVTASLLESHASDATVSRSTGLAELREPTSASAWIDADAGDSFRSVSSVPLPAAAGAAAADRDYVR